MSKIIFKNENKEIVVHVGGSILQAAQKGRIALNNRCGGKGSCTTCKIYISSMTNGEVSPPSTIERRMISEGNLRKGQRLGCQVKVYGTITVEIPEDKLKEIIRKQLERQKQEQDDDWF